MNALVTGASGMVGSQMVEFFVIVAIMSLESGNRIKRLLNR